MLREDGENRKLRERCEELEEEVRQLREALAPEAPDWRFLALQPAEAVLLAALVKSSPGMIAKQRLLLVLQNSGYRFSDVHILNVRLFHIRRRLSRWNVVILTHWGCGLSLPRDSKTQLEALRATHAANPGALDLPRWRGGGRPRP